MDDYIKSLLKDFFEEAFDMLDRLEQNILILDKDRNNTDAIQEIFRAVHTLKGSAGAVELFDTQKYAHRFEDLLDLIRNNQIKVDDKTIDILLKGIDILKELINGASEEKEYSGNIEEEIKNLENFKNLKLSGAISESVDTKSDKNSISVSVGGKYDNLNFDNDILDSIREGIENGLKTKLVFVKFNAESPMKTVGGVQVYVELKDSGEIIASVPSLQNLEGDEFYQNVIYVIETAEEDESIIKNITLPEITEEIKIEEFILEEYEKFLLDKKDKALEKAQAQAKIEKDAKHERQSSFLRVESDRIDDMMNQVGELVTNKSSYEQYDDDLTSYTKIIEYGINDIRKYYKDSVIQILRKLEYYVNKKEIKDLRNSYLDGFNNKLIDMVKMEED